MKIEFEVVVTSTLFKEPQSHGSFPTYEMAQTEVERILEDAENPMYDRHEFSCEIKKKFVKPIVTRSQAV